MSFANGIIVTSIHMAKGLEFDKVIVQDTDSRHYHNPIDRGLFYIACTRAMHKLDIFYTKQPSDFIQEKFEN